MDLSKYYRGRINEYVASTRKKVNEKIRTAILQYNKKRAKNFPHFPHCKTRIIQKRIKKT